jgi:peptidoglycan-associated lipoprotein
MKIASRSFLISGAVLVSAALGLSGCSSTPKSESSEDIVGSPTTAGDDAAGAGAGTDAASAGFQTVYFEFDSYILNSDNRAALTAGAASLRSNTATKIQIEGHCDERGSNEYNLALGEKRARAVEEFLISQGVSKDQLSTISYGEERPAVPGNDEEAWAKNRRADFVGL